MKYLLKNSVIKNIAIVIITIVLLSFFNCTTEDTVNNSQESSNISLSQEPQARITNNSAFDVNLDIYNVNGEIIGSEYGIKSGAASNWKSFSAGEITFVVNNSKSDKIIVLDMNNSMVYDMVIEANNQLASDQPSHI